MEPKQQTATSRASYFGNMKSRLGDRLPVSVTQPQGFPRGQWDAPPCPRATDEVSMPRHHIRNPKLRQYYLKEATLPCDVSTVQSSSGNEQGLSATPPYSGSEPSLGAMTPATPVSPSTDAEYDKLLDVEAVPMPDGQLCLLALPPECTQGAGPADMPYLKLFCRFITDRKGVVSGILLVTPNKIFFDPHKTLPLVQENGCEEYLFSCLLDNLTSITFFSDISHVHFSCSTQKWKGRKRAWKHRASKTLDKETTQTKTPTVPTVMSDLGVGLEAGAGEDVGGESQDMAEVERQLEHLVLGAGMLNSAATFCCGGVDTGIGASAEPTQVQKEARLSGPGEQLRSSTSFLMFVRMRQKQPTTRRRGFAALELSKAKTTPLRDAWFALQQEKSDELYAYLSQRRPDLSILEGAEEEEDEDDFVLLDDREDREEGETEGSPRHGHTGDEWEMVCVEDNRARISVSADREPEGLCDILKQSLILDAQQVRELTGELPARTVGHTWRLAYSTSQHGSSLKTLYRRLSPSDSPVLLIIRDHNQQAFGAFLSHPLCPSEKFYGTGESFLFLLHPRFKCFRWTGENSFFIKGDLDSFAIGGGSGHFGLWLDETLYLGRSNPCATFSNCSLSEASDFRVLQLEAWTFW
ncbi:nuclear receptor coactivator 7 isoform X2 [Electrophorus electricus]|uniref:nuclear receptor coactivator 7 isoform X2 n=1 Tax=Electrophorus electricus TaxID=8005 RepID=UPI0015CFA00A|nr:nuclear receptor coactivator 7 isoform X2 [Electrophorus electricus]